MYRDEALARAVACEARVHTAGPAAVTETLFSEIRKALRKASDEEEIANAPHDVLRLVRQTKNATSIIINGGSEDDPFVRASDRAEFNFGVTLTIGPGATTTLLAYRFHVKFAPQHSPPYVRIDLNARSHPDPLREPRAHVHAGAKDLRIATPLMHPLEVLDFVICGGPADPMLPPPAPVTAS